MDYYSAIKKNEIMLFVGKWMELKSIMLGEISQVQNKGHMFHSCMDDRFKRKMYTKSINMIPHARTHTHTHTTFVGIHS
jgi:putative heme degradation protein